MPKRGLTWEKLRTQFQDIDFRDFLGMTKEVNLAELDAEGVEILRLILHEKNEKAREAKQAEEALIRERLREITEDMPHRALKIRVPRDIDLEHAQAFLTYGLLRPNQARTFVGSRSITLQAIRRFVASKLGSSFDKEKFDQACEWLIRSGVITERRGGAVALATEASKASVEGRAVIAEVSCFLRNKFRK